MRKKFTIFYDTRNPDIKKAGTKFKPGEKSMVVMNGQGVFFLFNGEPYYPSIRLLSDVIGSYDVEWKE
jgi:hypothetical protein